MTEELSGFGSNAVRDGENFVKLGDRAEHAFGVQYQGPFESTTDGTARAVRLHARALADAGVPVLLQSFSNTFIGPDGVALGAEALDERIKRQTHDLRHASIAHIGIRVKHLVVTTADDLRRRIIPPSVGLEQDPERAMALRAHLYRTTIIYSVWERTSIGSDIAAVLRRVGECWVPCKENQRLLEAHGVSRVTVVPHPWDEQADIAKLTRREAKDRVKRFYAIGLWQPRKHFHEIVGAFLMAFSPGDPATLTIKHRDGRVPGYPSREESVGLWLADERVKRRGWTMAKLRGQLWLPQGNWPESEVLRLHYDSNIYVACSRGEAYCLPAFDAKVAGNRLVYVGFGGVQDFASEDDVTVPFEMRPIDRAYGWEEEASWAYAKPEDIAEAMASVAPPSAYGRSHALDARRMREVGLLMKERVEVVRRRASE